MGEQAEIADRDTFVDVSPCYGRLGCFRGLLPLVVRTNPHTYLSTAADSDPLGTGWLELALEAMENLRRRRSSAVRSVAVLGTGSGLDAVGISRIFTPERLLASDVHPRALEAARWNIGRYIRPETRWEVLESDLFRSYPPETRFDLVYENLPNVPDGAGLLDGIRAASCYLPAAYRADVVADPALLTLHFNCLLEALPRLRPGGAVVSMIGGRVPWATIAEVYKRAGMNAEVLHFGLKTQSEAGVVLEGYARAEEEGASPFTYYHPVEACRAVLLRHEGGGDAACVHVESLNAELARWQISAREAFDLHRAGQRVCHSVYAVLGTAAPAGGSQP